MRFQCPHCSAIIGIDDTECGQAVACGECGKVVVVPASRFAQGAVIGDFVLQKEIGQGGVGIVYLARQISLDRPAALKVLNERFAADETYVKDFIREARAAAKLNHPSIVQAYAVGEEDGIYYFGMELVKGQTLKQVLSHSGRIVVDRALEIIAEVNKALDFAWTQEKLVHRDIKPDNIILTESGQIKLADLGLARPASDLMSAEAAGEEEIMGTPQYISPEALLQKPMDNRSDIYSLGATLYHAVVGQFPFKGDNAVEYAQKHLTEKLLTPRKAAKDIPENVSRLIEIMMAKRPEHRYLNSAELIPDIELVRKGQAPKHSLSPDAQKPIKIEGLDRQRIHMRGHAPTAALGKPLVKKKKLSLKVMMRLFFGFLGLAMLVLGVLGVRGVMENRKTAFEKSLTKLRKEKYPEEQIQLYAAIYYLVNTRNVTPEQVLPKVRDFEEKFGKKADPKKDFILQNVRFLSQPFAEKEVTALRQPFVEADIKGWESERRRRQEDVRKAAAQQEIDDRARQATLAREKAAVEAKRRVDVRMAELRQRQQEVRLTAVDLGRSGNFSGAIGEFISLSSVSDAEAADLRQWAQAKTRQYEQAAEMVRLLTASDSGALGAKISIPNQRGRWTLKSAATSGLEFETRDYDKDGNTVTRTQKFTFKQAPGAMLVELGRIAAEKKGKSAADTQFMLGAYLLSRGDFTSLSMARQALSAAGQAPGATELLGEIDTLEPVLKKKEFEARLDEIKDKAIAGDSAGAKALVKTLREQFPDLYPSAADEINKVLLP